MPWDHEAFRAGDHVQVCHLDRLLEIDLDMLPWIVPKPPELLSRAADMRFHIKNVLFPGNGDIYYELFEIEGVWRESCLLDAMLFDECYAAPDTAEYYVIRGETRNGHGYVVIHDFKGVECLVSRTPTPHEDARAIQFVASIRHIDNFDRRYGFIGTWTYYNTGPSEN